MIFHFTKLPLVTALIVLSHFCFLSPVATASLEVSSTHETILSGRQFDGGMGRRTLLLDASGTLHAIYGGDGLYHAAKAVTSSTWTLETIDDNSQSGYYPNAVLAADGSLRIVYVDGYTATLKYASNAGGSWTTSTITTLDSISYAQPSVVLDSAGSAHVVFYDRSSSYAIKYAAESSAWALETVTTAGSGNAHPTILEDTTGNIHITFLNTTAKTVIHAYRSLGSWTTETVSSSGSSSSYSHHDAVMDSANQIHLCFYDSTNTALNYAHGTTGSWSSAETVEDYYRGYACSLGVASDGTVRVVYVGASSSSSRKFKLASNASGVWVPQELDSAGSSGNFISVVLDSANFVHAHYGYGTSPYLKYGSNAAGSWTASTMDTAVEFRYPVLAVKASGDLALVGGGTSSNPFYAEMSEGWIENVINASTSYKVSLAFDVADNPHVGYASSSGNYFHHATLAGETWSATTIDSVSQTGLNSSLALDSQGHVHIAYLYGSSQKLMYATNASGTWVSTVLDDNGSSADSVTLKIDANDALHIAYYNAIGYTLRYATNASGNWQRENVTETSTTYGMYSSLVLDGTGVPYVIYSDDATGDIKLAVKSAGAWQTETLITATESEIFLGDVSAQFSPSGILAFSYYSSLGQLKFAIEIDDSWSFQTIDDGDGETIVGSSNSLAFTSDNQAYIAYTDDGGQDIRLATISLTEATSAEGTSASGTSAASTSSNPDDTTTGGTTGDGTATSSGDASSGSATDTQVEASATSGGISGTDGTSGTVSDGSVSGATDGGTTSGVVNDAGATETDDDGAADGGSGGSKDDGTSDGDAGDQAEGGGGTGPSCQLSSNRPGNPLEMLILGFLFLPLIMRRFSHQNACKIS